MSFLVSLLLLSSPPTQESSLQEQTPYDRLRTSGTKMVLIQTHNSKRATSFSFTICSTLTPLNKSKEETKMKLSHPIILLLSAVIPSSGQDVSITTGFAGTNTGKLFCWRTLLSLSYAFCMMNFHLGLLVLPF